MQETQTQQYKLTQRLTPHLVADELFELSGRIQRRMRAFGVLHTVNLVQPTPRDLYEMAYAFQELLQLLEDQEPRLRQDIEIQKQKVQDSEARAVKYEKEAFSMQCRVEELENEIEELKKQRKQDSRMRDSAVSRAQLNEDVFRMKLRKEQRELERVKALASKNGEETDVIFDAELSENLEEQSRDDEGSERESYQGTSELPELAETVPPERVQQYYGQNSQFSDATVVEASLQPQVEQKAPTILKQPGISVSRSPQMNKSVSFRDQNLEKQSYEPRNQMDVVKSAELQRAIYFTKPSDNESLSVAQLGERVQQDIAVSDNDIARVPEYIPISLKPIDCGVGSQVPQAKNEVMNYSQSNYGTLDAAAGSAGYAQPMFSNVDIRTPQSMNVLESSSLEPPEDRYEHTPPLVPSFEVHMQAGKPNPIASLYKSNCQAAEQQPALPIQENTYSNKDVFDYSNGLLPYAEITQPRPGISYTQPTDPSSIQLSGIPNTMEIGASSTAQNEFTFPTIPVTVISTGPDFANPQLKINYQQLYEQQKGIQSEYCQIAEERRMIDAARSQVLSEEERVNRQRKKVHEAVHRLESSGVDVESLIGDLLQ